MSFFSYTANYFSEADEKRELSELSKSEHEEILDDMYGVKQKQKQQQQQKKKTNENNDSASTMDITVDGDNNDDCSDVQEAKVEKKTFLFNDEIDHYGLNTDVCTKGNDDNDDISDELLDEFHQALEEIPQEKSGIFWRACVEADDIVGSDECDATLFLRRENYDPQKAADRICEYWNMRYEIFGEDDAFKPMTLEDGGAMASCASQLLQIPNLIRNLPDDDQGRAVICWDRTGISFKNSDDIVMTKLIWFVGHQALKRESVQKNGAIIVQINTSSSWDLPSSRLLKLATKSVSTCLPLKICCRHYCYSSLVASFALPIIKFFMPREVRLRLQNHNVVEGKYNALLNKLETFGLRRDNLPKSIGGTYDKNPKWMDECERIFNKQKTKNMKDRRNKRRRH